MELKERTCELHGLTQYFKHKSSGWRCRACDYDNIKRQRLRIKKRLVEMFGGSCLKCGYKKSLQALNFHHRDPLTKKFGIASTVKAWEVMVEEAKKCDLLCANCHAEEHEQQRA